MPDITLKTHTYIFNKKYRITIKQLTTLVDRKKNWNPIKYNIYRKSGIKTPTEML